MRLIVAIILSVLCVLANSSVSGIDLVLEHEYTLTKLPGPIISLKLGDIDGDLIPEALVRCDSNLILYSLRHDSILHIFVRPNIAPLNDFLLADVNRDHQPDIVWIAQNIADSTYWAFVNMIDGTNLDSQPVTDTVSRWRMVGSLPDIHTDGKPNYLAAVDRDGDGFDELLISTDTIPYRPVFYPNEIYTRYTPLTKFYFRFPDSVTWSLRADAADLTPVPAENGAKILYGSYSWSETRDGSGMDYSYSATSLARFAESSPLRTAGLPTIAGCSGYLYASESRSYRPLCFGQFDIAAPEPLLLVGYSLFTWCPGFSATSPQTSLDGLVLMAVHNDSLIVTDTLPAPVDNLGHGASNYLYDSRYPGTFFALTNNTVNQYDGHTAMPIAAATPIPPATVCGWVRLPSDSLSHLLTFKNNLIRTYILSTSTGVDFGDSSILPASFRLGELYPNPFNGELTIPLTAGQKERVTIEVINISGQTVALVADREFTAGKHLLSWQPSGLSSGVYLVRATAADGVATRKAIYLK